MSLHFTSMATAATTAAPLTFEDVSKLHARQEELKKSNVEYLSEHPELKNIIADLTAAVLMEKPDDVFTFASNHFAMFLESTVDEPIEGNIVYSDQHIVSERTLTVTLTENFDRNEWITAAGVDFNDGTEIKGSFSEAEILGRLGATDTLTGELAAPAIAQRLKIKGGQLIMCNAVVSPSQEEANAARRIQAISRGRRDRERVIDLKAQRAAAMEIQCEIRGRQARQKVQQIKVENKAATQIQARFRGAHARTAGP